MIDLDRVIASVAYKPGWTFKRAGPGRAMLCVFATTPDSLHPQRERCTQHQFAIPADLPDVQTFARWLRDRLLDIERHECAEFLQIGGARPFFPHHQDEGSPYEPVERWDPACL